MELAGHAPPVVYVTVYDPIPGTSRSINPFAPLIVRPPVAVNVPPTVPVIVGSGSLPVTQNVPAEYENEASSSALIVIGMIREAANEHGEFFLESVDERSYTQ